MKIDVLRMSNGLNIPRKKIEPSTHSISLVFRKDMTTRAVVSRVFFIQQCLSRPLTTNKTKYNDVGHNMGHTVDPFTDSTKVLEL